MRRLFKTLSALLSYPTAEIAAAAPELRDAIDNAPCLSIQQRGALGDLVDQLADRDLYDLQERYVQLFDRGRALSLYLFEHVHGESRDRGQAMVDLIQLYQRHGLRISARELPDYLPLFLEFLGELEAGEAREMLAEPVHIIAALARRHRQRSSAYAPVFEVLESLAGVQASENVVRELLAGSEGEDPDDLEALDRAWEEEPVTFGPGQGCSGTAAGSAGHTATKSAGQGGNSPGIRVNPPGR